MKLFTKNTPNKKEDSSMKELPAAKSPIVSWQKPALPQISKAARKRVQSMFNAEKLIDICTRDDFSEYARKFDLPPNSRTGEPRFFYYQDNDSDILAVAHLDSVQQNNRCTVQNTQAGPIVCSGALDDRLGAYVILELLPALGMDFDILLTTDEECCSSTARDFDSSKKYNWMIEFDRGWTDVVMYDYYTPDLRDLVEKSGADVSNGSYSDIRDLEHLGVAGFNWGVGYQDYHSSRSHAWLLDTFKMVAMFEKFYLANGKTRLPFQSSYSGYSRSEKDSDWPQVCGQCQINFDSYDDWSDHMYEFHWENVEDLRTLADAKSYLSGNVTDVSL